jgi:hypothetical protein
LEDGFQPGREADQHAVDDPDHVGDDDHHGEQGPGSELVDAVQQTAPEGADPAASTSVAHPSVSRACDEPDTIERRIRGDCRR